MAKSNFVTTLTHRHDQVMNWLIANPDKKLRDCAAYFNYTQAWLSTLIHSEIFQAKFRERQEAVFSVVAADIPAKLQGLADMVTEQLAEQLERNNDKKFTLDAFDKIMHRAGYAPNKTGTSNLNITQNNFTVDKGLLSEARQRILDKAKEVKDVADSADVEEEKDVLSRITDITPQGITRPRIGDFLPETANQLPEAKIGTEGFNAETPDGDKNIWEIYNLEMPKVLEELSKSEEAN